MSKLYCLISQPDENSLDFSSCMLRPGIKNAQDLACGVCLLNVDSRSKVRAVASTVKLIFNLQVGLSFRLWLYLKKKKGCNL